MKLICLLALPIMLVSVAKGVTSQDDFIQKPMPVPMRPPWATPEETPREGTSHARQRGRMCKSIKKWAPRAKICNDVDDCGDNSDEENCPIKARKTVEIYFVADHKALMRYMREESSVAAAKRSMTQDIDYFITQLNVHYESLAPLDIVISKRALTILDRDLFTPASGTIAPETGLNTFSQWLRRQNKYQSLNYDLALLFTGYDLARNSTDNTVGLAQKAAVCRQGTAIVEYDGTYTTVSVAAHEIGHNLGADHDEEHTGWIMAPAMNRTSKDRWSFSPKSYSEIGRTVNSQSGRCLSKQSPQSVIPNSRVTDALATPDGVCRRKFGPSSFFCRSLQRSTKGDKMCQYIYCNNGNRKGSCSTVVSSDGLVCGAGKACKKGSCVVDRRANTRNLDENCLYGDQAKVTYQNNFLTCAQYLAEANIRCESESTRATCCKTCAEKATGNPDCPYGDWEKIKYNNWKEPKTCAQYLSDPQWGASCTEDSVRSKCCGTCEKRATGNPDCPYGDLHEPKTCAQYLQGGYSCTDQRVRSQCCDTCGKRATGNSDCPYGDLHEPKTCAQYLQGGLSCTDEWVRSQCCDTCGKRATGNPDCPYGDEMLNFNAPTTCEDYLKKNGNARCAQSYVSQQCCATCAKVNTGNPDCPYGDKKTIMYNNWQKPKTCAEYLQGGASCTDENVRSQCCDTCGKKATGNPDCPYGDQETIMYTNWQKPKTCAEYLQWGASCTAEDVRSQCCGTCGKKAIGNPDCPYGDLHEPKTCAQYLQGGLSCTDQWVRSQCCDTCGKRATGNSACRYGDAPFVRVNGLGTMTCADFVEQHGQHQCSHEWMKQSCCETCGLTGTGNTGRGNTGRGNTGRGNTGRGNTGRGNTGGGTGGCSDTLYFTVGSTKNANGTQQMNCKQFLESRGGAECNRADFKKGCCATCAKEAIRNPSGCYDTLIINDGTQQMNCTQIMESRGGGSCNTAYIKKGCCASCAEKATGNPSCPYGDKNNIMYNNQPGLSCSQIVAQYGNQQCYRDRMRNNYCCATCAQKETGIEDCPYGDRVKDCNKHTKREICRGNNIILCCQHCHGYTYRGKRDLYEDEDDVIQDLFVPRETLTNIPLPLDVDLIEELEEVEE